MDTTPGTTGKERTGLLAAGNFIIDHVKLIGAFPEQDTLVDIVSESRSSGGGAYNVLKDLARMGAGYPLRAAGRIGDDENGAWILEDCAAHGIDTAGLVRTPDAATSYTDAMTVVGTGRRTFFHQRGANARFDAGDVATAASDARLFHLAYLMLLDSLDALDEEGTTGAARLLAAAGAAGHVTTADLVSIDHPEFAERVRPALPHVDFLFLNELEAGFLLRRPVRSAAALEDAGRELLDLGVRRAVVLHEEAGAIAVEPGGAVVRQPSLRIPPDGIVGATGAGDAFVAGVLHAIHEGLPLADGLRLGVCVAAASLRAATPSDGVGPLDECLALAERFPFRDPQAA